MFEKYEKEYERKCGKKLPITCNSCGNKMVFVLQGAKEVGMVEKYEKRTPVTCTTCGKEMVFAKELMKSPTGGGIYLKYICPRREGERGCGVSRMVRFGKEQNIKFQKKLDDSFIARPDSPLFFKRFFSQQSQS